MRRSARAAAADDVGARVVLDDDAACKRRDPDARETLRHISSERLWE
jgi:hypothetical protein